MKKCKLGKKKYKIYGLKRKRTPENIILEPGPMLKEMRSLKKDLIQNRIKRDVPLQQKTTQLILLLQKE